MSRDRGWGGAGMARHRLSYATGHMGLKTCKTPKPPVIPPPPPPPIWVPWSQTRYPHQAFSIAEMYHIPWSSPGSCMIEDGVVTYAQMTAGTETQLLIGLDLQFDMPVGATVDGVFLEVKKRSAVPYGTSDQHVWIMSYPDVLSENKWSNVNWPTVLTWFLYGSDSDTWTMTLTDPVVNHLQFAVGISAMRGAAIGPMAIDVFRLTLNGMAPG